MLLDKLEAENRATRRRRLQLAGIFLGGGFVLGLFSWPSWRSGRAPNGTAPDAEMLRADNTPVARAETPAAPDDSRPSPAGEEAPPRKALADPARCHTDVDVVSEDAGCGL